MKKLFLTTLLLSLPFITSADTEYLPTPMGTDGERQEAEKAAKTLTEWEKANPEKKIISVGANIQHGAGYANTSAIKGFWITFELKPKQ